MAKRGRPTKEKKLVDQQLGRNVEPAYYPKGDSFIIPNHSGISNHPEFIEATNPFSIKSKIIYIEDPDSGDSYPMFYTNQAITLTMIRGLTDTGTVNFNIEERTTADVNGTDAMGSDLQAQTTEQTQDTFSNAGFAANTWATYVNSSVANSPTKLWVVVEYTID